MYEMYTFSLAVSVVWTQSSYTITEGGSIMVCAEANDSLTQELHVNVKTSPGTASGTACHMNNKF